MTAQVQWPLVRTRPMSSGKHAVLEIQKLLAAGLAAACTPFHGVVRAAAELVHNLHVKLDIILVTARATWPCAEAGAPRLSDEDVAERYDRCVDAAGSVTFLRKCILDATKGTTIVMEAHPLMVRQSPCPWT